ncbi:MULTISPECIES: MFS transporter [unclassified Rhizobium]|uniref:MFS transporter n=1 Tax=unclassified Rhizobium TaxID=2613769 RepID=UPI00161AE27B|nr:MULTISPECIES: MFS transporter [unclassified Rhizobium]MBB3386561.1 MFS family permease [Rhizobium sp. BK098]MBB3618265.1 MFS family permease [Rhizobium sp. BK609]MBB3683922.1 MFS family permease [Rhizobium sp. BK612]
MSRKVFGRQASFLTAAAVVAHTIWTSAAPALTYPLYAQEWHLTTFMTTAIFAVYPVFVVFMLVVFGNVSDYIGRREAMLLGLAASLTGTLIFALAPDVDWIFIGRAFMGVGVGLSAGPSAAAMVEFSAPGRTAQAGSATAAAQAFGMIGAALVGGALIEYAPLPTRLNFAVLAIVLTVLTVATWMLPNHTASRPTGRWRPRVPAIPNGLFATFVTATAAVTASYVLGAMTLSLGAQVARDVIASQNALVNGGTIALFAVSSAIATIPVRGVKPSRVMLMGSAIAIVSSGLLALAAVLHSLVFYTVAQIGGGMAYSLLLLGGLSLINAAAPVTHRGATLSALFLVAYLAQAVVALLLGKIATWASLSSAVDLGVATVATLALITLLLDAVRNTVTGRRARKAGTH